MQKRKLPAFLILITALLSLSAAEINLLRNTNFDMAPDGSFWDWSTNLDLVPGAVTLLEGEGVDGCNAVRVKPEYQVGFGQGGLKLIPGEKYRISVYVRTRNLDNGHSGVVITDWGWNADYGVKKLPRNAEEWTLLQAEIVPKKSANGLFGFVVFSAGLAKGEFDLCLPAVVPLTEKAKLQSDSLFNWSEDRRIVPLDPLLYAVPCERASMKFFVQGRYAKPADEYAGRVYLMLPTLEDWQIYQDIPIQNRNFTVDFGVQKPRDSWIKVELVDTATDKVVLANDYPMVFVKTYQDTPAKKMNEQVSELYNVPAENGEKYPVMMNNPGWLFISLTPAREKASGSFDGKKVLIYREGENQETFVRADRGEHVITLDNIPAGSRLVVRRIPELLNFPRYVNEKFDLGKFQYDMDFHKKYIFPASCVLSMTSTGRSQEEVNERGIMNIRSGGIGHDGWTDAALAKAEMIRWWEEPSFSGRIIDELRSYNNFEVISLGNAFWELLDFDKFLYTYLEGHCYISHRMSHTGLMSAMANVSRSQGKLVIETYIRTRTGADGWKRDIKNYIDDSLGRARKCGENINPKVILLTSGFLTAGRFNCNAYPDCDFKYLQDQFYHRVATDPELAGIGGVGVYCFNHCDEELTRWIFTLQRHYFVEGRTDMLSDRYGITYQPGFLKNCDFKDQLAGWQTVSGNVKAITFPGLGKRFAGRRNPVDDGSNGDTAVQFRRAEDKANKLAQVATGLIPGKYYSLKYVTCDGKDLQNRLDNPPCVLNVAFNPEEAQILPEKGYLHRFNGRAMFNTHRYVFKALKKDVTITFSDWQDDTTMGAPVDQVQLMNFVNLTPYFPEEP